MAPSSGSCGVVRRNISGAITAIKHRPAHRRRRPRWGHDAPRPCGRLDAALSAASRAGVDRPRARPAALRARLQKLVRVEGLEHWQAVAGRPVIWLAPHFVGLDMGGTRIITEWRGVSV